MGTVFTLDRIVSAPGATVGSHRGPDGAELCVTLERPWADNKEMISCIAPGEYVLALRKIGESPKFDKAFSRVFGAAHRGMIEITGVPGRTNILFHTANFVEQLEGCIAGGLRVQAKRTVRGGYQIPLGESRPGYIKAYTAMADAIENGGATLLVKDPPVETQEVIAKDDAAGSAGGSA